MSFQYCPMLDYSQNSTIIYDDNLLSSIIPANMMIKQEHIATDDLLLTSGFYPQMHQHVAAIGYPSDGFSSCSSNSSSSSACDLTYYGNTAASAVSATTSPSSHYSHDSFYSPSESMTSFDFFPSNTPYYDYLSNQSSPAPVNQPSDALYFEQPLQPMNMSPSPTFSSTSSSNTASVKKSSTSTSKKARIEGRPYSCPSCPRAFARKHDLQRHIRVHTGDKPYMCPCCKKTFARTDALKRHLRMEEQCRKSEQVQAMKETGRRRYRNL